MDLDFGYNQNNNNNSVGSETVNDGNGNVTNISTGNIEHDPNGTSVDDIDDETTTNTVDDENNTTDEDVNNSDDTINEPLQPGTSIEVEGKTYTVDDNGNVLDENGNVFKEASEVNDWINSFDQVDDTSNDSIISIQSIQDAIGIDITDDDNNVVSYENTPKGIKDYINDVIDSAKNEHYETAIATLYQKYPILNDVLNYYIANGNSLEGFAQVPDRSNIVIEEDNEEQQEAIIRTAWAEREQKGDVNSYIAYLKSSGALLSTAREELDAIKEADEQYRQELEEEAERIENERIEKLEQYWNDVYDTIQKRTIAGYQIPESIIVNRNNQKISVTPDDFFNYIYRVDKDGKSAYERDLEAETPESRREDEILRAYLKFVGGNYSNLVDMAINKEKVNKLKLIAKERNTSNIRINRPKSSSAKGADIDLGYN